MSMAAAPPPEGGPPARGQRPPPPSGGARDAFESLLRRFRLRAGLSQEALAQRAGLSAPAVGVLEQGQRRRPHPHTIAALADALGLSAAEREAFVAAARAAVAPASAGAPGSVLHLIADAGRPKHNLPAPLTALIGREGEAAAVVRTLAAARLVTLVGPGGVGKTRLALAAAWAALGAPEEGAAEGGGQERGPAPFPDGVWLAELAALADPALAPATVAAALGVREEPGLPLLATLGEALRPRRLLLVLDNCEHLLPACAALAASLLAACPNVRVLAASRQPLGLPGEVVRPLAPLALPPPGASLSPGSLLAYGAPRLFVERARAARPDFALTAENAPAVAAICSRLDGLPLALELAARQLAGLAPAQLAARLDDRFRLLTGGSPAALPRQQTLRAAIAWSYDRLAAPEQALFRRLAVFAGGWTLDAAAVGADAGQPPDDPTDVPALLVQLVDRSLVLVEAASDGDVRYRMLETLREYARERLEASGEAEATRARHAAFYGALAEAAAPALHGGDQAAQLARLDVEHANLRQALGWLRDRDPAAGLRLAACLVRFWRVRGHVAEGSGWLADLLARAPGGGAARVEALLGAADLALHRWDLAAARAALAEAEARARAMGDSRLLGRALRAAGNQHIFAGDRAAARRALAQSLGPARAAGDAAGVAEATMLLGVAAQDDDDLPAARALLAEGLAGARAAGDHALAARALWLAGRVALRLGALDEAERLLREGLATAQAVRAPATITRLHDHLARVAYARADLDAAADWHTAGLALARETADEHAVAQHLQGLGVVAAARGDAAEGAALLEAALERFARLRDRRRGAAARQALALVAGDQGEPARALALLRESLTEHRALGDREGMVGCLEGLAALAADEGDARRAARAARLLGAATAERARLQAPLPALDQARLALAITRGRTTLGAAAWDAAHTAGALLSLEQAAVEALG